MRIISFGKVPEEQEYTVVCAHCKSILGYTQSDAVFCGLYLDKFVLAIKCPICNKQIVDYRCIHSPTEVTYVCHLCGETVYAT